MLVATAQVEASSAAVLTFKPVEIWFSVCIREDCVELRVCNAIMDAVLVRIEVMMFAHFSGCFANVVLTELAVFPVETVRASTRNLSHFATLTPGQTSSRFAILCRNA
jgi:hypothetical protein